jgi:hypothetical protein
MTDLVDIRRRHLYEGVVIDPIPPLMPLPPFDDARTARFERYVATLREVFHRADQALRFRAYARGLLEPGGRKNVEGVAAAGRVMMVEANLPQALQHFISHSPWAAGRLFVAVGRPPPATTRPPSGWSTTPSSPKRGRVWSVCSGSSPAHWAKS